MIDVPEELKGRRQWVVWRMVMRDGRKTKILFNARTGRAADSTDPDTWSSFMEAELTQTLGGYNGVGYVFSKPHNVVSMRTGEFIRRIEIEDPYTGIDLDDCIGADGQLVPWAAAIVARFNTRTEISPSGKGVKMFIRGKLPRVGEEKCRCRTGDIEVYDRARYFTVTGNLYPGTPAAIMERQTELVKFFNELFPPPPPRPPRMLPVGQTANMDDAEVIRRASNAANGRKFKALFFQGSTLGHQSGSEADLALCSIIAFWVNGDAERIDAIFRASALCDEKWEQRADYRAATIGKAISQGRDYYAPRPTSLVGEIKPRKRPANPAP